MPKNKSEHLFLLVKSLKKSEKRYFKLFVQREERSMGKKFLLLFDLIDQQQTFNEEELLRKEPALNPAQLSNLKAHLYRRILQSLRLYNTRKVADIEIREMIDHAVILFNRSLYEQCAKMLEKAWKKALKYDTLELQLEILKWEKLVMAQTVGRGNQKKVNNIISEVQVVNGRINNINTFTNISAKLNSFYLKAGFIRNQQDYEKVTRFLQENLPDVDEAELSFSEKLHLYELLVGYYAFLQEFDKGYEYARRWVALFNEAEDRIAYNLEMYIKGINNLMIAQYKLLKYHEFTDTHKQLKRIRQMPNIQLNENIQIKLFKYNYVHEFNRYFMLGDFSVGVQHFNKIKSNMEMYINRLDKHSRIIMYYKIACLYFGNGNHREVIGWLNKIINLQDIDLREDIHCFARIMNLVSHYELGNNDVIEYYLRSTYRFLLKKDDLHHFQKYILSFLKHLNRSITEEQLLGQFERLRQQLLPLAGSRYEKRPFIYFDIISWLEAKLQKSSVEQVIREKARRMIELQAAESPLPGTTGQTF